MQGNVKVSEDKQGVSKYHSKPVRIALFGLGRIGQIHLSNILANRRSTLLYCVETVPERQNYVKTCWNLNDVKFIRPEDADQVFMDPDVDAVIVGTPTFTHQEITMKALKAKKAVLCEKPLADSFEGMVECYKLAKANNVPLFCAFNRRFDPTYMECYNRLHSGEIGKLLTLKLTQKDSPFPSIEYLKHSGGFFHDSAIHDSDMMLWMTKQRPNKVYSVAVANFDAVKQINDFDTMVIVYSFPSGLICIGDLARQSNYGYDQRVELYGMDGVLFGTNRRPTGAMAEGSSGTKLTKYYESFASRYAEAYMNEIRHFVDAIQGKFKFAQPSSVLD